MNNNDFKSIISKKLSSDTKWSSNLGNVIELKKIGEGGNSIVYSGKLQNHEVALKFLCNPQKDKKERFIAEFCNIQRIPNKNIVKYISLDKTEIGDQEVLVIVMEKYKCQLQRELTPPTKIEFNKLLNFLLDSLEHVHSNQIFHRDIKPENILVDYNGEYILSDFGIAGYNSSDHIKHNTTGGERLGNRLFSAPEQEIGNIEANATMDIFAIGQILYRYVTGDRIVGTGHQKILQIIEDIDPGVDVMIKKCTDIDPEKRFQSIKEIRDFLILQQERSPLMYIQLFDQICRSTFPKKDFYGVSYTNETQKIDRFFYELEKNAKTFGSHLWYNYSTDGKCCGNMYFHPRKTQGLWKLALGEYTENPTKGLAYDIVEMRVFRSDYEMKDFVLIHYAPGKPQIIEGKKCYGYYVINNKHIVTFGEGDEGYAEINGEIYDLSEHPGEFIELERYEGYLFISTNFNTVIEESFDKKITEFTKSILDGSVILSNKTVGEFGRGLGVSPMKYGNYGIIL